MLLVKLELKLKKLQLMIVRTSSPTCTKPNVSCSTFSIGCQNFEMSKKKKCQTIFLGYSIEVKKSSIVVSIATCPLVNLNHTVNWEISKINFS